MKARIEQKDGITIMRLDGIMDLDGVREFKEQMQSVRKSGSTRLVVDFTSVSTAQSQVMQHLLTPVRAFVLTGNSLGFCNMNTSVHKVMETGMMFSLVTVYNDVDSAVAAMQAE